MSMFIETEQGTLIGPDAYQGIVTKPSSVVVTTLGEGLDKFIQVELSFNRGTILKLYRRIAAKEEQPHWDDVQAQFNQPTKMLCRLAIFRDTLYRPDRNFWNFAAVEIREGLWLPTDEHW